MHMHALPVEIAALCGVYLTVGSFNKHRWGAGDFWDLTGQKAFQCSSLSEASEVSFWW